jgi:O-antigen/teichoic acid export membrane protein
MQYTATYETASKFLYIIFVICAIYFNFKLIGILIANVISLLLVCLFLILFLKKYIKIRIKFDFRYIISKLKITGFFAGIAFFTLIYYNADKLLVSFFIGDYQLGLYVIGYTFFGLLISFIYIFNSALFPILSQYSNNVEKYKRISELYLKYVFKNSISFDCLQSDDNNSRRSPKVFLDILFLLQTS